ncbi:MAG: DEAD/DEAH box helicase [Bacteroidaceae bacterium]|nr:DEAD/DEAH box helicase [Bacteroidaceae bacterium]
MYFDELPLDDTVLDALDAMHFEECTPIQEQAIPPLLKGRDLIGVAQTGTGKTAAYLLPVLNELNTGAYPQDACNCLIMAPTRELAQQIDRQVEGFAYFMPFSSVAVYGGNDGTRYEQERRGLTLGADIIIATPGRLISHLTTGKIDFSQVSFFILDEADRMLDMGFYDDIMKIASYLPKERQTIMFSATMPDDIQKLAHNILNNPVEVKIAVSKPAEKIRQIAYICYDGMKDNIVRSVVEHCPFDEGNSVDRVIIFCAKKTKVRELGRTFRMKGLSVGAMHSDLSQQERDTIMRDFRNGHINILIATDIVSRGIDIDDIQMVINYDTPRDPEDYVHRIGRTARANRDGMAVTLVTPHDYPSLVKIEKLIEREIDKPDLPEGCGEKPDVSKSTNRKSTHRKFHGSSDHRHRKHSHKGNDSRRQGGRKPHGNGSTPSPKG